MFRALLDWRRYFEGASQENPRGINPRNIWNSASTVEERNKAGCQEKPLCQPYLIAFGLEFSIFNSQFSMNS